MTIPGLRRVFGLSSHSTWFLLLLTGCGTEPKTAPGQMAFELSLVFEQDITPAEATAAVRPDAVLVNDRFYVGYSDTAKHAIGVVELDQDFGLKNTRLMLGPQGSQLAADLIADDGMPTDLRMSMGADGYLWCAFEEARFPTDAVRKCHNCSNYVRYRLTPDSWVLDQAAQIQCVDRPCVPGPVMTLPSVGTELQDDPAPFHHDGMYYVFRRQWGTSVLPAVVYDSSLAEASRFNLDLTSATGGMTLSVFSLLHIDTQPWLVGAAFDGPPILAGSRSYLIAVPLTDDLRAAASAATVLSQTDAYQYYVSGARYDDGKLYITHNIIARQLGDPSQGLLKVFDLKQGADLVSDLVINEGVLCANGHFCDNHLTVEVAGTAVYVFYPSPEDRLMVRGYEWR